MEGALDGKVAIVTGGGRGVGRGIAVALARAGASIVVLELDPATGARTAEQIIDLGGRAIARPCDVTDADACAAGVDAAVSAFGGIDVLVNNAQQVRPYVQFDEVTEEDMELCWRSGPLASFRLMQLVRPHLVRRGGGAIVNLGSGAGTEGLPGFAAYASAKEAIRGLSKVAAREWGPDNIRVNVICPFAAADWYVAMPEQEQAEFIEDVPLGRIGDPEADIGATVAFLASSAGSYVTGQTIMVDGGAAGFR